MLSTQTRTVVLILAVALAAGAAPVDFQTDVRPVLSNACFQCHGPDANTRMAGLRLDTREGAFAERPNGAPIVAGDAAKSLVYQRLTHENAALRMPPERAHKELGEEDIATIKRWIDEGASWTGHWAFEPPVKAEPPAVGGEWARSAIDQFVMDGLREAGLSPAAQADKRTLIRRVTLDLTGLPPTVAEVEAFLADGSADAYENLVDRLLESPRYGEHRARYWLDAARYADTHGLHIDNYREMWLYRDWVIDAFNRNLSFDEFTVEQIAGDLLPEPTEAQLIATGFHRNNVTTNEGGVIDAEVAAMYDKDRVDTTGTVWLGLTVGCATCHDHKFDPISQKDFYSLAAFFRNTTQKPRDGNVHDNPPVMRVPSAADREQFEALAQSIPAAQNVLARTEGKEAARAQKWQRKGGYKKARSIDRHLAFELVAGAEPVVQGAGLKPNAASREDVSLAEGPYPGLGSLEIGEDGTIDLAGFPQLTADEAFSISVTFYMPEGKTSRGVLASQSFDGVGGPEKDRGWVFEVSGKRPAFRMWGKNGYSMGETAVKKYEVENGSWNTFAVAYDGSRMLDGLQLYVNGRLAETSTTANSVQPIPGDTSTDLPFTLGRRMDGSFKGMRLAHVAVVPGAINEGEARRLAAWTAVRAAQLGHEDPRALTDFYLYSESKKVRAAAEKVARLRADERRILKRTPVTHVMHEKEDSEPHAFVLHRGMYDQPRDRVPAATPAVLPAMESSLPRNRLGLAKWLVDENNPLVARVAVNRFWQEVFGVGIVESAEDFGSQGTPPSNQALLDWVAVDFRENGWDVKWLMKQLVTSATYMQSAATTPAKLEEDPQNRMLSRGPRFRMDAEVVRDYALAASGLLHGKIGGPSVKPYQPGGLWKTVAMKESNTRFYERDDGARLYRRSLYTFWKRSAPPAAMEIFNAPTREHCLVRRERTNTPLQALVTMNDPQFVEAARHLAAETLAAEQEKPAQIMAMSERLLARPLAEPELAVVMEAYRDFLHHYDSNPDDARKLLATGASSPADGLPTAEFAALTMVANQLLNLDEVLNK